MHATHAKAHACMDMRTDKLFLIQKEKKKKNDLWQLECKQKMLTAERVVGVTTTRASARDSMYGKQALSILDNCKHCSD